MAIEGILPVIPTPFADSRFDARSFDRLCEHMLDYVDGYTLLGSTGEAPSLSTEQRMEIAEYALARTPADKTVVVGVTHTSLPDTLRLAAHAQEHGAAAVLCAMPFYFANTPQGLLRYLAELNDALRIELVLYDNPTATKTKLDSRWVVDWADRLEHLNTVKLTDHALEKIAVWHDAGLKVMGGDDPIAFRFLAADVDGAMMIAPALFPEPFRLVWNLVKQGEITQALSIFSAEILPVVHVFGIGDEIATTKVLLKALGVFETDQLLPPLDGPSSARCSLLNSALAICREASDQRLGVAKADNGVPASIALTPGS